MADYSMDIANFNLTFGKEEAPMLDYFEDFIYPAFLEGIEREKDEASYYLDNIKLVETELGIALTGLLVKNTIVNILSKKNKKTGELEETNESHPTAPYSFFCLFLKNHRLVFVPNQKESPRLVSFATTIRYILKQYAKLLKESDENKKIPGFELDVIGIASKDSILKELKKVDKISSMNLRFYPLNGEDLEEMDSFVDELIHMGHKTRKVVGSRTLNMNVTSPQNKDKVAELAEDIEGTAETTLHVVYPGKQKGKIKHDKVVQKRLVQIDSDHIANRDKEIIKEAEKVPSIVRVSKTNKSIYEKFYGKISKLLK